MENFIDAVRVVSGVERVWVEPKAEGELRLFVLVPISTAFCLATMQQLLGAIHTAYGNSSEATHVLVDVVLHAPNPSLRL